MIAPARTAAFTALRGIEDERIDLPTALAQSRERLPDERDRALAAEIIAGTLRWRGAVDHLIAHFAGRPIGRLDIEIVTLLRLSLYQILHLTRVPASAVVDDAVDLARAARKPSATGFVNAVLRAVVRQRNRLPLPPRPEDHSDRAAAIAYLSITHSHPEWLVARWLDRLGFDATERWVEFNNETPTMTLRANRLRVTREQLADMLTSSGVTTMPTAWAPDGLAVTGGNPFRAELPGTFVVQDEASQLVSHTVAARSGERVLDLCASPGGKSTALTAAMRDHGLLVACDVRPRRIRLLADAVRASGATCVRIVQVPRTDGLPFTPCFDRVLVDAPCSSLGTVRRDPDVKWRRKPEDLAVFAGSQLELLRRAADLVRPGGRLVYATCSSEPEENERVVTQFLAGRQEFSAIHLGADLPGSLLPLVDGQGHLRTLPHKHRLEAFFAAALGRAPA